MYDDGDNSDDNEGDDDPMVDRSIYTVIPPAVPAPTNVCNTEEVGKKKKKKKKKDAAANDAESNDTPMKQNEKFLVNESIQNEQTVDTQTDG